MLSSCELVDHCHGMYSQRHRTDLTSLLEIGSGFQTIDIRDKVFAVLGLIDKVSLQEHSARLCYYWTMIALCKTFSGMPRDMHCTSERI